MEIDKNSWHFRLLDKMNFRVTGSINYGTVTLCEYTWSVIGALTAALIITLVVGLTFYGDYVWMFAMPTEENPANILQGLAMFVSLIIGIVVGILAAGLCVAGGILSIMKLFPKKRIKRIQNPMCLLNTLKLRSRSSALL